MIGFFKKKSWGQQTAFKLDNTRERAKEFAHMFGETLLRYGFLKIPAHLVSGCLAGYMIFKKLKQVVGGEDWFLGGIGIGLLIGLRC